MTVAGLAERIRLGELSPREAVQSALVAIESASGLNAFISLRGEEALAEAERVEKSTPTYRLLYRQVVALERIIELLERQNPAPHPWLGKS